MCTEKEKLKIIEEETLYIEAINKVLYDAITHTEISNDGDYLSLLELQNKSIDKVTELF